MEYTIRRAPCTHCGDTVLIGERTPAKLFGYRIGKPGVTQLEHADPTADGEVFDGVDDACRRPPVHR